MYRLLKCDKDAYITDKIINSSRSLGANTGQASSLDLFKLYNESYVSGSSSVVELSRILMHFDLSPIRNLTSSVCNIGASSFRCFLSLNDIYGGQPIKNPFTIAVNPLAKPFSEGSGRDIVQFMDIDATNWLTASVTGSTSIPTLWEISGASKVGLLGSTDVDYYGSGNLGSGVIPLSAAFSFTEPGQNLFLDITTLVSGVLSSQIPDYGFRLAFTSSFETDAVTYFAKRFSSRHVRNTFNRPKIHIYYNESVADNSSDAFFSVNNTIGIYNQYFNSFRNFISGGIEITGSNSVILDLIASRSLSVWTSSFSQTHSASINHLTRSWFYFSASFTGSQTSINGLFLSGAYNAVVNLDPASSYLSSFMNAADWQGNGKLNEISLIPVWKTIGTRFFLASGSAVTFKPAGASPEFVFDSPYIVTIPNLKNEFYKNEKVRFRVVVYTTHTELKSYKVPTQTASKVFLNMFWRLKHAYSNREIIPFETTYGSTKLSSDGRGMFFDFWMEDLDPNQVYEFEFLIKEDGKDRFVTNQSFIFKVVE